MIRVLISEEQLTARIKELAESLYEEYGDNEVVFVCTLKGAVFFTCELLKHYKGDARLEFLRVSSYNGQQTTGEVELNLSVSEKNIKGKDVVLLEDIVDKGYTLEFLKGYIGDMKPKTFKMIALLDKETKREAQIDPDCSCFKIDDLFVVGFGLDDNQKYRNLPFIGVVEPDKELTPEKEGEMVLKRRGQQWQKEN